MINFVTRDLDVISRQNKVAGADDSRTRLTKASYADGAAAPRSTDLTPREISDRVANQDNNGDGADDATPNAFAGSNLLA